MSRNYKAGRRVIRKHDEWYYFDLLPAQLRHRLAAATLPWSSNAVLTRYRKLKKAYGEDRAIRTLLAHFDGWDRHQAFNTPWERPKPRQQAEPTPCMQASVGPLITRYACVG